MNLLAIITDSLRSRDGIKPYMARSEAEKLARQVLEGLDKAGLAIVSRKPELMPAPKDTVTAIKLREDALIRRDETIRAEPLPEIGIDDIAAFCIAEANLIPAALEEDDENC